MPTRQEVAAVLHGLRLIETQSDPDLRASVAHSVAATLKARFDMTPAEMARAAPMAAGSPPGRALRTRTEGSDSDDGGSLCEGESEVEEGGLEGSDTFDVEVLEERAAAPPAEDTAKPEAEPVDNAGKRRRGGERRSIFGINLQRPRQQQQQQQQSNAHKKQQAPSSRESKAEPNGMGKFWLNFLPPRQQQKPKAHLVYEELPSSIIDGMIESDANPCTEKDHTTNQRDGDESSPKDGSPERRTSLLQTLADDFLPHRGGDFKILRAIGRTAAVNAAVLVTAATGGAAGAVGYAAGGAIASKRLVDGLVAKDDREVTKSLAVYGAATGASVAGQAVAGALLIGIAGASLPVAGAAAFGVGCCGGMAAGALSEWTVDRCMEKGKGKERSGGEARTRQLCKRTGCRNIMCSC